MNKQEIENFWNTLDKQRIEDHWNSRNPIGELSFKYKEYAMYAPDRRARWEKLRDRITHRSYTPEIIRHPVVEIRGDAVAFTPGSYLCRTVKLEDWWEGTTLNFLAVKVKSVIRLAEEVFAEVEEGEYKVVSPLYAKYRLDIVYGDLNDEHPWKIGAYEILAKIDESEIERGEE